jgi:hypothetical protein
MQQLAVLLFLSLNYYSIVNVLIKLKGPIKYPSQACDGTVYTPCIANAYCNASAACTCNTGYFFNVSALTCG